MSSFFNLLKILFKIAFYGIDVVLVLCVIIASCDMFSHNKEGRFFIALLVSALITLLLESWLHGGLWWFILAFSTVFSSIAYCDDPSTSSKSSSSDEDGGGLDAGDGFLLGLIVASMFEKRNK